jgi:tRNA(Ile)-lysidine synthase
LKKLNPNIKEVIAKFSKILSDENEFISNIIKSDYSHILKKKNRTVEIDVKKMKKMHVAIKRRIIRDAICYVKGDLQGIGFTHIEYILSNLEPIHPLTIDLPHNIQVKNRYGKIIISKKIEFQKLNKVKLPIPGNTQINNLYISTNSCDGKIKLLNNPKSGIFLDLEKVSLPLYIRGRKNGDRIYIKNLGTKKVSDLFIDKKVPKEERDSIPFLVDRNDKILWIVGFYINKFYLAKKRSKKVLQIRIRNL